MQRAISEEFFYQALLVRLRYEDVRHVAVDCIFSNTARPLVSWMTDMVSGFQQQLSSQS